MTKTKKLLIFSGIFLALLLFKISFANAYLDERLVYVSGSGTKDVSLGETKNISFVNVQAQAVANRVGYRLGIALLKGGKQIAYKESLSFGRSYCPCFSGGKTVEDSAVKFNNVDADTIRIVYLSGSGYYQAMIYGVNVPNSPGQQITDVVIGFGGGCRSLGRPHKVYLVNAYAWSVQNRGGGYQLASSLYKGGANVAYRGNLYYARSGFPLWSYASGMYSGALNFGGTVADTICLNPVWGAGGIVYMFYRYDAAEIQPPCTPDPSCAANTCPGKVCHSCGVTYPGTANPPCNCNPYTCKSNVCYDACGRSCGSGTLEPENAECGEAVEGFWDAMPDANLCKIGDALADPVASGKKWTWTCDGVCGGKDAFCRTKNDSSWKEVTP